MSKKRAQCAGRDQALVRIHFTQIVLAKQQVAGCLPMGRVQTEYLAVSRNRAGQIRLLALQLPQVKVGFCRARIDAQYGLVNVHCVGIAAQGLVQRTQAVAGAAQRWVQRQSLLKMTDCRV